MHAKHLTPRKELLQSGKSELRFLSRALQRMLKETPPISAPRGLQKDRTDEQSKSRDVNKGDHVMPNRFFLLLLGK